MMLGLSGTIDQLAMANGVRWHGSVEEEGVDDVQRRALWFVVEGGGVAENGVEKCG